MMVLQLTKISFILSVLIHFTCIRANSQETASDSLILNEISSKIINDYLSSEYPSSYNVFQIIESPFIDTVLDYYHLTIIPVNSPFYMGKSVNRIGNPTQGGFPIAYWVKDDFLFVYTHYKGIVKKEIVTVLEEFNVLDTINNIVKIDESLEGVDYFLCKNDINKMIKIKSSEAIYRNDQYRNIKLICELYSPAKRRVSK